MGEVPLMAHLVDSRPSASIAGVEGAIPSWAALIHPAHSGTKFPKFGCVRLDSDVDYLMPISKEFYLNSHKINGLVRLQI